MKTKDILASLKPAEFDDSIVFSGRPTNTKVKGYAKPCLFTPKINPSYIFHEASRDIIVWLIAAPSPLCVCGVMGAGKSTCISQLAARLNYPVFEVTGHNRLEFQDLVGHHTVQKGEMRFEYGPIALAMKYGGLFLLNELDLLEPSQKNLPSSKHSRQRQLACLKDVASAFLAAGLCRTINSLKLTRLLRPSVMTSTSPKMPS